MGRKKAVTKPEPDVPIEFPPEDREWIAIQEKTIAAIGKPIEDSTSLEDRQKLREVLAESEMDAVTQYQRRKRLEEARKRETYSVEEPMKKEATGQKHHFARILGKHPCRGAVRYSTKDQFALFVETFGPPEISSRRRIVFWNFTRCDGGKFSLVSRIPAVRKPNASIGRVEVEVRLVAKAGIRSFWEWTAERLSGVESAEENPPFLGAANFVVQRLG
jgi:hypothetical protein